MDWGFLSKYRSEIMGVCCLWIILHHNFCTFPDAFYGLRRFAEFGNIGVDVFLLLSGVGLYFSRRKKTTLREYYLRRFVRVLIPYLLIALPYWIWLESIAPEESFLLNVTMLSFPLYGSIDTWYIFAILMFYFVAPVVFWLLERKKLFYFRMNRHEMALLLIFGIIVVCFFLRKFTPVFYDNFEIALTRFAVFVLGCYMGEFVFFSHSKSDKKVSGEVALYSIMFLMLYWLFRETSSLSEIWLRFSFIPVAICVCICVSYFMERFSYQGKMRRFFCYLGERSLEIYLSHVLIRDVFWHYYPEYLFDSQRILDYLLVIIISIGWSEIVHRVSQWLSKGILRDRKCILS